MALIVAVISGISVFMNKWAVTAVQNSDIFTSAKNLIVGMVLVSGLILARKWPKIKVLDKKEWFYLIIIGIVGGSIPFLLFFKGLSLGNAATSAFLHKSLFLWVVILAIPFLKEKLSFWQVIAIGVLLFGNYFLGDIKTWHFGIGERLVFLAVIFWAIENILAKKVLKTVDSDIAAAARMFFGGIILFIYLIFTNKITALFQLSSIQWIWVFIGSAFLLGYVTFWYSALKKAPVTIVTCILVLGSPITTLLDSIFITHHLPETKLSGIVLITISLIIFVLFNPKFNLIKQHQGSKI